jgi:TonB family protein
MHSVIQPVFRVGGLRPGHLLASFGLMLCLVVNCAPHVRAQSVPKLHRKVIVMHDPEYPAVLKNGHFEGQVKIDATVLPNGTVSKVEVKGGNPILAQYASEAVMRWKYVPSSAQTIEEVTFNFNPNNR